MARRGRVFDGEWSGDGRVNWRYPTTKNPLLIRKLERVVRLGRFPVRESRLTFSWIGTGSLASHEINFGAFLYTLRPDQPDQWARNAQTDARSGGRVGGRGTRPAPDHPTTKPDHALQTPYRARTRGGIQP